MADGTEGVDPDPLDPMLDHALVRRELTRDVQVLVPWLALGLALIQLISMGQHLAQRPEQYRALIAAYDGLCALALGVMAVWLRMSPPSPRWAHAFTFSIVALVVISNMLPVGLLGSPLSSLDFLVIILALGLLMMDLRWFLAGVAVAFGGWALAAWVAPVQASWGLFGIYLAEGVLLAGVVFFARTQAAKRTHALRLVAEAHEEALAERNRDLDAFARTVSHDLKNPLNSAKMDLHLLKRWTSEEEKVQDAIHRLEHSWDRMDEMITALLDLGRAGRADIDREDLDLTALTTDLWEDIARQDEDRDVTCTIAPGLRACGDEALVRILYQNLLQNAWKFTKDRDPSHIEIGWDDSRGALFVSDDGPGFTPDDAAQLFGTFTRLEGTKHIEGTGLGLSTVQRIVERHGGRIWAEGAPDKGATFLFTLPEPAQRDA